VVAFGRNRGTGGLGEHGPGDLPPLQRITANVAAMNGSNNIDSGERDAATQPYTPPRSTNTRRETEMAGALRAPENKRG